MTALRVLLAAAAAAVAAGIVRAVVYVDHLVATEPPAHALAILAALAVALVLLAGIVSGSLPAPDDLDG